MPCLEHDQWLKTVFAIDPIALRAKRPAVPAGVRSFVVENDDGSIDILSGADQPSPKPAAHHASKPAHQNGHANGHANGHGPSPAAGPSRAPSPAPSPAPADAGALPRPMAADCKIVRHKVPGPKHHVLCATHNHVIDEEKGQIIANSLADYKAKFPQAAPGSHGPSPKPAGDHPAAAHGKHSAPAGKAKAPADPDAMAADPEDAVKSTGHADWNAKVIETAHFVVNRARINATQFTTQLQAACEDFKGFGEGKIRDMQGELQVGDVMQVLAGAVMGEINAKITAAVTDAIGKAVVKVITGQVTKAVTDAAKAADPNSSNPADLSRALGAILQKTRDSSLPIIEAVTNAIDAPANAIIGLVSAGKPLGSDQEAFIMPFFEADASRTDEELEKFGIPGPAKAKEMRLAIYKALVGKFEEKLIWAQASFGQKLKMGFARDVGDEKNTLKYKAGQAAQAEADRRGAEMGP